MLERGKTRQADAVRTMCERGKLNNIIAFHWNYLPWVFIPFFIAVYHFLANIPNVTSYGVPEVAMRMGGQWQMRECERRHNSEVTVKKTPLKRLKKRLKRGRRH